MKNLFAVFAAAITLSANSFAVYAPGWERPILTAEDMEIVSATQAFEHAERVDLTLTKRDGQKQPTGMIVSVVFPESSKPVVKKLTVTDISMDRCGTTTYIANLPKKAGKAGVEARYSVVLEDHSFRRCKDIKPARWEASVRQGYGWCGTMDATMTLQGEPNPVFTIQSR